ncbi:acyltransferase [Ruegeria atlantica]|uniref:acyltransferase n=1 Tax=Ruegeria atlantica TaxID=81569 RepID=UPI001481918B|nr:acetyltransferase [Ruegeria atlantica]
MKYVRNAYRAMNRYTAIRANVSVGKSFVIGVEGHIQAPDQLKIGDNVNIGRNFYMACNGTIGSNVLISSYVGIVGRRDHDMKQVGVPITQASWIYSDDQDSDTPESTICIEDDVWIGFGAILLSGITVGRGAVIGAGSLVNSNVESYDVVAGNPAKKISRRFSDEEIANHENATI